MRLQERRLNSDVLRKAIDTFEIIERTWRTAEISFVVCDAPALRAGTKKPAANCDRQRYPALDPAMDTKTLYPRKVWIVSVKEEALEAFGVPKHLAGNPLPLAGQEIGQPVGCTGNISVNSRMGYFRLSDKAPCKSTHRSVAGGRQPGARIDKTLSQGVIPQSSVNATRPSAGNLPGAMPAEYAKVCDVVNVRWGPSILNGKLHTPTDFGCVTLHT